jgi:eukaryotic-like serine/threonine-protein kinase
VPRRALELLDDHQIVARIGRGGMAEIFLARRPAPSGAELVVIKRLHPDDAQDPAILQMFLDEARLALRLTHRSIVRALGVGVLEGRHALVLEFLEGQTLQAVHRRMGEAGERLPLEVIVPAFADALEGLHYAHELTDDNGRPLHVVHRDVSPHNLFVTSTGSIKVLDFGIAKTAIQENRTRTGLLKGKVAYMAPEQAQGSNVDRRADVWSLGVTLWESLVGARLFRADNEAASLRLTLMGPVARPSSARPEIPGEIDAIVMRALQRDPVKRYPTAGAMAEALRSFARRRNLPTTAPARDIMAELFGQELAEQRARITSLLSGEAVPISSSVPALSRPIILPESGRTHVSTMTEFLGRIEDRPRRGRRRIAVVFALGLAAAAGAFAYARFATRGPERALVSPVVPQALETATPAAAPEPPPPVATTAEPTVAPPSETAESAASTPPPAPKRHSRHASESSEDVAPPTSRRTLSDAPRANASGSSHADADYGFLTLDTSPWSQVTADGTPLGQTPIVHAKLPAGSHTLVLVNSERGLSTSYQITIEPGKTSVKRLGLE